jgi:dipeptidyl aminopeptidase/acylaminoacyl peptidase
MNASDGSSQTNRTSDAGTDTDPAWSPDGLSIAFTTDRDGDNEIYTMNTNGTGQTNRSNDLGDDRMPSWKASSGQIVFSTDRAGGGDYELYRMNADGSLPTNASNDASNWNIEGSWRRTSGPGADFDQDGCTDAEEARPVANQGGLRNPQYFWDYYQVWTFNGSIWVRDNAINILDITATGSRFGSGPPPPAKNVAVSMALTAPTSATGYHIAYDRGMNLDLARPWKKAPPDGTINIPNDILGVAGQFNHNC